MDYSDNAIAALRGTLLFEMSLMSTTACVPQHGSHGMVNLAKGAANIACRTCPVDAMLFSCLFAWWSNARSQRAKSLSNDGKRLGTVGESWFR